MIDLAGREFDTNIHKSDKAYQDFLNYVICGNELTSDYYVKLVRVFKALENKLEPTK